VFCGGPMTQGQLSDVLQYLKGASSPVRVLQIEVLESEKYGVGTTQINPWIKPVELKWPSCPSDADQLTSLDMPLSLVSTLQDSLPPHVQLATVSYLLAIIRESSVARKQLAGAGRFPLVFGSQTSKQVRILAADVEQACKQSLQEVQHGATCADWTDWASSYEVWVCSGGACPAKVRLCGVGRMSSAFDFNGWNLTGGRIWAGSVLLLRWAASCLSGSGLQLGQGPALELGSGIGLAGIALAKLGHKVVLSDREPVLLDSLREHVKLNEVQDRCRVLELDWAAVRAKSRLLRAQHFSLVIGADLVYEGREQAQLLAEVLKHALPFGGTALFTNARFHRRGPLLLGEVLREAGYEVEEGVLPCSGAMQHLFCGQHEPSQEYMMCKVRVPHRE